MSNLLEEVATLAINHKRCSKCGVDKPFEYFSKDNKAADKLQSQCKGCKKQGLDLKAGKSKVCATCKQVKGLDSFYGSKTTTDGKQGKCKECCKKYQQQYQAKLKQENLELAKEGALGQSPKYLALASLTAKVTRQLPPPTKEYLVNKLLDLQDQTTQVIAQLQAIL